MQQIPAVDNPELIRRWKHLFGVAIGKVSKLPYPTGRNVPFQSGAIVIKSSETSASIFC